MDSLFSLLLVEYLQMRYERQYARLVCMDARVDAPRFHIVMMVLLAPDNGLGVQLEDNRRKEDSFLKLFYMGHSYFSVLYFYMIANLNANARCRIIKLQMK
jgi:hypothetical protein